FTNGDTVTLTASPGTNSAFAGWSGDVYGMANPLVLQLNASVMLTANFIYITPTNPPSIIQQPTSATLSPGSTAVLEVQASGQPALLYQWRFNGVPLPDQTNVELVLPSLVSSQAGQYDVVVSGPAGTVTSNPALLALFSLQVPASSQGSLPLLILDSAPGSNYRLEFTDDPALGTWQMLSPVTLQSGRAYYIDQPASEHSQRFYRAAPQ
ncbi:MAG TPA: immunoglobulin domain-containing protein, partial [Verrucomicrobiae bacterium]|nr:immunoglobulin domain-containing protein [Verrucomicrobiae bacterium]